MGLIDNVIDSAVDAFRFKDTVFYKENSDLQKKYDSLVVNKEENKNKLEVYKTLKSLGFNDKQINLVSSKIKNVENIDQMIEEAIELISHEQQNNSTIIKA